MATLKKHWRFVWAVFAFLCIILLYTTFRSYAREQKERYNIICFGDSIFGQTRDETSISALLAQKTGMTVYNGAFGGTGFTRLDQTHSLFRDRDGLSFAAVSQAVAYEDFAFQQTIRITDNGTEYFEENIETLDHIDFASTDVFVVAYGVNDYHAGTPLVNPEDLYDPYTFAGSIRQSIKFLQTRYHQTRILLLTPTYRWITEADEADETGESRNTGYGNLLDYIAIEKEIAQEMKVELLDHYDLYPHETYEDWRRYTIDGLHPNQAGRERIAQSIADYLSDNP